MAEQRKYYIRVPEALVEVSKDLYSEYHRIERHLSTLEEKDARHGLVSLSGLDTRRASIEETIADQNTEPIEDQVIAKLMAAKLKRCINMLPLAERELIRAIYYDGMSERQVASKTGIHYMTLPSRKKRILGKLKKMMEKEKSFVQPPPELGL